MMVGAGILSYFVVVLLCAVRELMRQLGEQGGTADQSATQCSGCPTCLIAKL
jgi:hypothetical protein